MSAALVKQAEEQLKLHEKTTRRLDADKHQQNTSFQEKLNARLKKKEEKQKQEAELKEKGALQSSGSVQVEAPIGNVVFSLLTVKNVASFWECLDEDSALKALEDIHDLVIKDLIFYNVYKAKGEIGKFLLAAENPNDLINCVMKIQANFNDNKWSDAIMKIPGYKKLVRPEDSTKPDAKPLFNGPRIQIGIHRGEVSVQKTGGETSYSGVNVLKTESIGNFAQGGQILVSDVAWKTVDVSKLDSHNVTEPGVYKLDGFSAGCKVFEVLPDILKDRSKFFGSVCAHCNEVIKPNEQFFRMTNVRLQCEDCTIHKALDCIWHMNHFRCFVCNTDLGGSYVECEGSPYCKNCYLIKNAPKCKNCSNPITGGYINALGGYWHTDCFSCKRCLKKPSPDVQIYENEGFPYCGECYKQIIS